MKTYYDNFTVLDDVGRPYRVCITRGSGRVLCVVRRKAVQVDPITTAFRDTGAALEPTGKKGRALVAAAMKMREEALV
jgi:hypothetical protein